MLTEFTWQDSKGIQIQGVEWKPDGEVKGIITLVHGLGEHCRRYSHFAEFFNQHGLIVQSFDLPGHGKSGGIRGHIDSYDEVSGSIDYLTKRAVELYPELPRFLYGHSLGGALVTYHTLYHTPDVRIVFASAPGMSPYNPVSPGKLFLANWMNKLFPTFTMKNDLDLSGLSRDPEVEKAYRADPLVHGMISARLGLQLLNNGAKMLQTTQIPLPYVLLQGSADRLVNPVMNIAWGERLKGDAHLKVWEGFYHELHNEPQKEAVFNYILTEIQSRM